MKKLLFACAAVAVFGLVESDSASADHGFGNSCRSSFGGFGSSFYRPSSYGSYSRGSSFGNSYYGNYGGYSYRQPTYHDPSHYDYHPTTIQRHRNHDHVIPGHYHWHQTGHWHR
ncbi:MAG: hypothetical protein O3A00_24085 [Planctomycetota bacterium]|nr:hypothetical protein [Planctomycetota bacterium]